MFTNLYWLIGWCLMPTHLNWLIVCLVFNANKFINFALQNRKYNGQSQLRFPRIEKITFWISTFLKKYRSAPINADFLKFVGPSWQKITRTGNTAKYAGPGVRQYFWLVYFVLHRKSEMQLVCRNYHVQLGIRFCFKWHLLLKHATVSMVILLIIVFL